MSIPPRIPLRHGTLALAAALALGAGLAAPARAQALADSNASARAELERLRATTQALIDALVSQGLLTRERADAINRQAAAAGQAAAAAAEVPGQAAMVPAVPAAQAAAKPANVIRVPYVSETLRHQLREEIKNEVMASAREEGWADSRAIPPWTRGITVSGDFRLRAQGERYAQPVYALDPGTGLQIGGVCDINGGNAPAECFTRQVLTPSWAPDLNNTTNDRNRMTLRARLAVDAKVTSDTAVGLRLSTGSTSGPASSSQTLGNGFNKSTVVIDRAFLRWEPRYDLGLLAGRMANPFFGSDLTWPDDLGFDGVALQADTTLGNDLFAFGTAGVFPLQEFSVDKRDKWLYALQAGVQWAYSAHGTLKLGVAVYDFANVQGVREALPPPGGARAGTVAYQSSAYPGNLRAKGNTLINLNDPSTIASAAPVWGLASRFRPINLSAELGYRGFEWLQMGLGVDWVRNTGFDMADIRRRALDSALTDIPGRTSGLQVKLRLGRDQVVEPGDWQASVAWRKLERDAWIDGFTDTTWHLGGTNYAGWQLGGQYAFDRRTTLGLRLTSTRNLDDGVRLPTARPEVFLTTMSSAPLKIDVLQLDLSTRF